MLSALAERCLVCGLQAERIFPTPTISFEDGFLVYKVTCFGASTVTELLTSATHSARSSYALSAECTI